MSDSVNEGRVICSSNSTHCCHSKTIELELINKKLTELESRIAELERLSSPRLSNNKDMEICIFSKENQGIWMSWFYPSKGSYQLEQGLNTKNSYKSTLYMLLSSVLPTNGNISSGTKIVIKIDKEEEIQKLTKDYSEDSELVIGLIKGLEKMFSCFVTVSKISDLEKDQLVKMVDQC